MIHIAQGFALTQPIAASMFADRKRLFVDTLRWDVPVVDGRFEIDGFDGAAAIYLIALDQEGSHCGSMRLLPTTDLHILDSLFGTLCCGDIPRGPNILEITRLCLPLRLGAAGRLAVRNRLISAMVDYALEKGVIALTGVVSADFREQVLAMGWRCEALGETAVIGGSRLGAFRIDLDDDTRALLALTGIYVAAARTTPLALVAAEA